MDRLLGGGVGRGVGPKPDASDRNRNRYANLMLKS